MMEGLQLFDLKEAAAMLNVPARTLRYYAKSGRIPARRGPRNKIVFRAEDLRRYVESLPRVAG